MTTTTHLTSAEQRLDVAFYNIGVYQFTLAEIERLLGADLTPDERQRRITRTIGICRSTLEKV
jgi:hypothetical protein